jgi:hypothetical protein
MDLAIARRRLAKDMVAALLVAMSLAATSSVCAQSYNAAQAFAPQTQTNPNGVWTYGYLAPALNEFVPYPDYRGEAAVIAWSDLSHMEPSWAGFAKNVGSAAWDRVAPGEITLRPGPTMGDSAFDDASVLRFTAPISGAYLVKLKLLAGDVGETEAWVVKNHNLGSPLMHFASTSLSPSWNKMLKLERGATLDVVVGHSPDSFLFDNTPLTLVITKQ